MKHFLGEARLGTDESAFNSILATRSWAHLRHVMAEYQSMFGKSLEKAVMSEFSGNAEKVLLGICKNDSSKQSNCALKLQLSNLLQYNAQWIGTHISPNDSEIQWKDWALISNWLKQKFRLIQSLQLSWNVYSRTLIRLIVGHWDTDLGNIQQEYEKKFLRSLAADVVVYVMPLQIVSNT